MLRFFILRPIAVPDEVRDLSCMYLLIEVFGVALDTRIFRALYIELNKSLADGSARLCPRGAKGRDDGDENDIIVGKMRLGELGNQAIIFSYILGRKAKMLMERGAH